MTADLGGNTSRIRAKNSISCWIGIAGYAEHTQTGAGLVDGNMVALPNNALSGADASIELTDLNCSDLPLQIGENLRIDGQNGVLVDTDPVLDEEVDELVAVDKGDGGNPWSKSIFLRAFGEA